MTWLPHPGLTASGPVLHPWGQGTVTRTLVRRVALLVAVVAILLDGSAVMVARRVWIQALDAEVYSALRSPFNDNDASAGQGPWASEIDVQVVGGRLVVAWSYDRDDVIRLSQDQVNVLMRIRPDARVRTVNVPDLGPYRVAAQVTAAGQRVVGVSMGNLLASFSSLLLMEALLTIAAVIAAASVAAAVVRRTLRPLTALATTASRVASMRLDQGEVHLERLGGLAVNPASEVGQVGLAFNHMLDNVEDALVARHRSEAKVRAFVADASHELRNPLAAIRGYAELMGRDKKMTQPAASAVDRIGVESRRMSTLVEEMLLLARLDQGTVANQDRVDLSQVLVDAVADATVAGPDHVWKIDVPDDPIEVIGDENQMHEVVANLLGNARKHTPPGTHVLASLHRAPGPVPSFKAALDDPAWSVVALPAGAPVSPSSVPQNSLDGTAGHIVLTVADDGPGVPDDLRDHVFERFVRADQARTHDDEGSSGLGLAIVAGVVQSCGGEVTLESVPGATKFTVLLPAAPVG